MMVKNVGSPEMLRVASDLVGSDAAFVLMHYHQPWLYQRLSAREGAIGDGI
jgi:hypothetical protein